MESKIDITERLSALRECLLADASTLRVPKDDFDSLNMRVSQVMAVLENLIFTVMDIVERQEKLNPTKPL